MKLEVDIIAKCSRCYRVLRVTGEQALGGVYECEVEPCEVCLDRANDRGRDEGYKTAEADSEFARHFVQLPDEREGNVAG